MVSFLPILGAKWRRAMVPFQMMMALLVLGGCVFWPRTGQAALLIAVDGSSAHAARWAHAHSLPLLGQGRMAGSMVVKSSSLLLPFAALAAGNVLLAVPETNCAPASAQRPPLS